MGKNSADIVGNYFALQIICINNLILKIIKIYLIYYFFNLYLKFIIFTNILLPLRIPVPVTDFVTHRNPRSFYRKIISKNVRNYRFFKFGFQIAFARKRGANYAKLNFQKGVRNP